MIGQLRATVLDCPEPAELARFYAELIGGSVVQDKPDWVTVQDDRGRRLSFQRAPEYRPPRFPDPAGSQQLHLDIQVEDPDAAERAALAIGATRLDGQSENAEGGFRVFADPAGHPFCLVWLN
jgi:hypothetical protein